MDLNIKNKVVLVTGGASGIGESVVKTLAEEGAIPIILDRDPEAIVRLKHTLGDNEFHTILLDLESVESCKSAISETLEKYQRIDGLVNNAGLNDGVGLEHGSPDRFEKSVSSNLFHYYYMAHYALPGLKESKGSIINVASKTAVTGQGGTSGYIAAKGAQLSLTREWALELLPYDIRVNAVIPAEVRTPMFERWVQKFDDPNTEIEKINQLVPLENRMTSPDEIGHMVVFLLSNKSSHVTGQQIFVDGGYTHLDRAISVRDAG